MFKSLLILVCAVWMVSRSAQAGETPQLSAKLGRCVLSSGAVIRGCQLGYRTYGKINADNSNIVIFPSWYNGTTADMGPLIGAAALVDPNKYFVVTIDSLGDGVSSSPSNGSVGQKGAAFPKFTIGDMVEIERRFALEVLKAPHIHAVIGISMGGMQAFEWAIRFPKYMDVVIPIVGTPWLSSADQLTWSIMRQSITDDPKYKNGGYSLEPKLALANEVDTMFAYTSHFRARNTSIADFPRFLMATHDQESVGANNRVWQIDAIAGLNALRRDHNVEWGSADLPKMLIITSRNDQTVNPGASLDWARHTDAGIVVLEGDCGHLAVQCELNTYAPVVRAKLAE